MANAVLNAPPGFAWVRRLAGWNMTDSDKLKVMVENSDSSLAEVSIACHGDGIWRVCYAPGGNDFPQLPILVELPQPKSLNVVESMTGLTVSCGKTSLVIRREPWRLSLQDATGRIVWRENPDDVDGLNRLFILPFGFVRALNGDIKSMTQAFHLEPGERLYGLGEKFTRIEKSGQCFDAWTLDALGSASERAYKNVPLLISSEGFGLFVNTSNHCHFDLGAQSCESATFEVEGNSLDYFLMAGQIPADVLRLYTDLTGRAPLPPRWSFGLWLSGSGIYRDDVSIRRLALAVDQNGIPCDVIHIDPWWMRWRRYADFQWDLQAFPDPEGLITDLHTAGLKLSVWQHPYISVESELFSEGCEHGYFALRQDGEVYAIDYGLSLSTLPGGVTEVANEHNSWNARVAIIDLTNPNAVEWYKSLMEPVLKQGIDVFKTDFGEDIPRDACFSDGRSGAEIHNLYPLLYNQAVFEVTQKIKGHGLIWGRSAWAGSQRYPIYWSGDPACTWDSLAFTIRGGLSLGLSGIPFWSNDIGGYRGHPDEKLYIRWAQFGLLCSHARCHGESQREPWHFGEKALVIFRQFANLRYRLFPYIYSCAHESTRNGLPVLRAMPLAFPNDPNCADKDFQFMLGPDILVAPVIREDDQCKVYLPPGNWFDYWTDQLFHGPLTMSLEVPIDRIPIYVRAGSVIAMMQPASRIPVGIVDPLVLHIFPGDEGEETVSYVNEDEGETRISVKRTANSVLLMWNSPSKRTLSIRIHPNIGPASEIDDGWNVTDQDGSMELGVV